MKILNNKNTLSLQMLYAGYHTAGKEWCYNNVISPFSRMYLIDKGEAAVYMNKKKYNLSAGELFIIPKFTFHMYECDNFMYHYYICFFDQLIGGQSLFDNTEIHYQLPATEMDRMLMLRFLELNSDCAIQDPDPKTYDNIPDIYTVNQNKVNYSLNKEIESNGILLQLFSRFLGNTQLLEFQSRNQYERLAKIFSYIDNNLYRNLRVDDLAEVMCLSSDHFTRVFKQVSGMSPNQYVQAKRIERAQTLLLASRLSIKEIAETVGIPNLSQFSKLFIKHTVYTPREYKNTL